MEHIKFNTLAQTKKLVNAGFTQSQAEAQVEIMTEFIAQNMATKNDISELETTLTNMETVLKKDMVILSQKMTIRLGTLMAFGIVAVATLVKVL